MRKLELQIENADLEIGSSTKLIDKEAAIPAREVYSKLEAAVQGKYLYLGQMEFYWDHESRKADQPFKVSGKHPSILGVDFDDVLRFGEDFFLPKILEHYSKGGMVTMMGDQPNIVGTDPNPNVRGRRFDLTGEPFLAILPGGSHRSQWIESVKRFASFVKKMPGPVLIRNLHEMDGDWDWWGTKKSTPGEYRSLWKDWVWLFQLEEVHNAIWVWAPGWYSWPDIDPADYYPGDDYVDIIGVDRYSQAPSGTQDALDKHYYTVPDQMAKDHGKLFCIAEGFRKFTEGYQYPDVWTNRIMNPILSAIDSGKINPCSFSTWWSPYWGPDEGRYDAGSYIDMVNNPRVKMLGE